MIRLVWFYEVITFSTQRTIFYFLQTANNASAVQGNNNSYDIKFIEYFIFVFLSAIFSCLFLYLRTHPTLCIVSFPSRCTNPIYSNSVFCLDTLPPLNRFFLLVNFPLVFIAAIDVTHATAPCTSVITFVPIFYYFS